MNRSSGCCWREVEQPQPGYPSARARVVLRRRRALAFEERSLHLPRCPSWPPPLWGWPTRSGVDGLPWSAGPGVLGHWGQLCPRPSLGIDGVRLTGTAPDGVFPFFRGGSSSFSLPFSPASLRMVKPSSSTAASDISPARSYVSHLLDRGKHFADRRLPPQKCKCVNKSPRMTS